MKSCFQNDNQFLFTQPLRCFIFHLSNLLLTQNFVYPTIFSLVPPPAINNDRPLSGPLVLKLQSFARCSAIFNVLNIRAAIELYSCKWSCELVLNVIFFERNNELCIKLVIITFNTSLEIAPDIGHLSG